MVTGLLNTIEEVLKKKNNISLEQTNHKKLSIQFSLGGFSFCITNADTNTTVHFQNFPFEEQLTSLDDLLHKIEGIFKETQQLHLEFTDVEVFHENELFTLVPYKFYNEEELENYLKHNIKVLKTDFIATDDIDSLQSKNVYVPYVNINNFMFQHFGEFEYKHSISVLVEKLLKTNTEQKTMFVNVNNNSIDIVVIENNNLLLCNSYNIYTKEDFLYYILFVAEQLQMDPEVFTLKLLGNISKENSKYDLLTNYVKNVSFLESSNNIYTDLNLTSHSNYILLG